MVYQFEDRSESGDIITQMLIQTLWESPAIRDGLQVHHLPHGYELCLPQQQVADIQIRFDEEALRIKHRPDYILRRQGRPDLYLEYKTSRRPRYTEQGRQWDVIPIEAESWNECSRMSNEGHRVAFLVFCPYHPRPLTCEIISNEIIHRGRQIPGPTIMGTGEPFMNVDLSKFRTLPQLLDEEMGIPTQLTVPILDRILETAANEPTLQIEHHPESEWKGKEPKWQPW